MISAGLLSIALDVGHRLVARVRTRSPSRLGALSLGGATFAMMMAIPPLISACSSGKVNLPVPGFSLRTATGSTVSSADLRGRVVVLAFWATWCIPCREELPALQTAYERYSSTRNATFYAVDGPWGGDTIGQESAFAARMNVTLPLAFDLHGAARQALGVYALPAVIILDSSGHVRLFHEGYDASERLGRLVATEANLLEGVPIHR